MSFTPNLTAILEISGYLPEDDITGLVGAFSYKCDSGDRNKSGLDYLVEGSPAKAYLNALASPVVRSIHDLRPLTPQRSRIVGENILKAFAA